MMKKGILFSFTLLLLFCLNVNYAYSEEINKARVDNLLRQQWEGLKRALKQKDIEGALKYFSERTKSQHRQIFDALKEQLPAIMDTFVEFNIIRISGNTAEYEIVAKENGRLYSYPGNLVKDEDGIWRFYDF